MKRRKSSPNGTKSIREILRIFLVSLIVASAVLFGLTVLFALLVSATALPSVVLELMAIFILIFAGFFGGYPAAKSIRKNGLQVGLICGASLSVLLFLLSGVVFDTLGWQLITKMLIVTSSSAVGGVLGVNSRKKYR